MPKPSLEYFSEYGKQQSNKDEASEFCCDI